MDKEVTLSMISVSGAALLAAVDTLGGQEIIPILREESKVPEDFWEPRRLKGLNAFQVRELLWLVREVPEKAHRHLLDFARTRKTVLQALVPKIGEQFLPEIASSKHEEAAFEAVKRAVSIGGEVAVRAAAAYLDAQGRGVEAYLKVAQLVSRKHADDMADWDLVVGEDVDRLYEAVEAEDDLAYFVGATAARIGFGRLDPGRLDRAVDVRDLILGFRDALERCDVAGASDRLAKLRPNRPWVWGQVYKACPDLDRLVVAALEAAGPEEIPHLSSVIGKLRKTGGFRPGDLLPDVRKMDVRILAAFFVAGCPHYLRSRDLDWLWGRGGQDRLKIAEEVVRRVGVEEALAVLQETIDRYGVLDPELVVSFFLAEAGEFGLLRFDQVPTLQRERAAAWFADRIGDDPAAWKALFRLGDRLLSHPLQAVAEICDKMKTP